MSYETASSHEKIDYAETAIEHLLDKIEWFVPFHIQLTVQELIDEYLDTQETINISAVDKAFEKIGDMRNDIYFAHYYSRLHYRTVFLSRYSPVGYVSLLANV